MNQKINTIIIDMNTQDDKDLFYKWIHLKDEIGAFIYLISENNLCMKLNELKKECDSYSLNII